MEAGQLRKLRFVYVLLTPHDEEGSACETEANAPVERVQVRGWRIGSSGADDDGKAALPFTAPSDGTVNGTTEQTVVLSFEGRRCEMGPT